MTMPHACPIMPTVTHLMNFTGESEASFAAHRSTRELIFLANHIGQVPHHHD